jgi:hypothetical protein
MRMSRVRALACDHGVMLAITLVAAGCGKSDGGELVATPGMTISEVEAASRGLGSWWRTQTEFSDFSGMTASQGAVDNLIVANPAHPERPRLVLGAGLADVIFKQGKVESIYFLPRSELPEPARTKQILALTERAGFLTARGLSADDEFSALLSRQLKALREMPDTSPRDFGVLLGRAGIDMLVTFELLGPVAVENPRFRLKEIMLEHRNPTRWSR